MFCIVNISLCFTTVLIVSLSTTDPGLASECISYPLYRAPLLVDRSRDELPYFIAGGGAWTEADDRAATETRERLLLWTQRGVTNNHWILREERERGRRMGRRWEKRAGVAKTRKGGSTAVRRRTVIFIIHSRVASLVTTRQRLLCAVFQLAVKFIALHTRISTVCEFYCVLYCVTAIAVLYCVIPLCA